MRDPRPLASTTSAPRSVAMLPSGGDILKPAMLGRPFALDMIKSVTAVFDRTSIFEFCVSGGESVIEQTPAEERRMQLARVLLLPQAVLEPSDVVDQIGRYRAGARQIFRQAGEDLLHQALPFEQEHVRVFFLGDALPLARVVVEISLFYDRHRGEMARQHFGRQTACNAAADDYCVIVFECWHSGK